ncbi:MULTISPECIES: WG repeat-containing protein [Flavobacterium]|uniref:WG repeat-containing protein n=1 Tax=Flavobacterium TaxID=237 RepID=UPI0011820DA4|nr:MULTISPECIES: WG repeat-containing protein [Flavobacterium]MCR4032886.1 WG repeat-containing protein [Flavobacterium panacis]
MKRLITIWLIMTISFAVRAQKFFEMKTYEENGKIGLLDENGKKITSAKYDKLWLDSDGKTVIAEFQAAFYDGLCSASMNQKIGFINKKGDEIVPFQFSRVREFNVEGLAAVSKDGKWGFINKRGKEVIPIIYDKVFDFENGKALVVEGQSVFFIDTKGKETNSHYSLTDRYEEGKLLIIKNNIGKYGFMKKDVIYPAFYDFAQFIPNEDYLIVQLGGKIGIVNNAAKEIISPIYDKYSYFDGKYFYLWKRTEWDLKQGIIDNNGKIISPFVYGSLDYFIDGLSRVKLDLVFAPEKNKVYDEKYGFIDETGKEVIPRIYDFAWNFKKGRAKVRVAGREFYIDKTGKEIEE